jgi:peptide/nickel transport system permease protein
LPILTVLGDELAGLVNGSVVIEVIFAWPGIGFLAMIAIQQRDFPLNQADVILVALAVVLINLIIDLAYAYLDPRVRYG